MREASGVMWKDDVGRGGGMGGRRGGGVCGGIYVGGCYYVFFKDEFR